MIHCYIWIKHLERDQELKLTRTVPPKTSNAEDVLRTVDPYNGYTGLRKKKKNAQDERLKNIVATCTWQQAGSYGPEMII